MLKFVCCARNLEGKCGKPAPRYFFMDFEGSVPLCDEHAVEYRASKLIKVYDREPALDVELVKKTTSYLVRIENVDVKRVWFELRESEEELDMLIESIFTNHDPHNVMVTAIELTHDLEASAPWTVYSEETKGAEPASTAE